MRLLLCLQVGASDTRLFDRWRFVPYTGKHCYAGLYCFYAITASGLGQWNFQTVHLPARTCLGLSVDPIDHGYLAAVRINLANRFLNLLARFTPGFFPYWALLNCLSIGTDRCYAPLVAWVALCFLGVYPRYCTLWSLPDSQLFGSRSH